MPEDGHSLFALTENGALEEAMLALEALGYSAREIAKVKKALESEEMSTEGYMKRALQLLLKQQ